MWKKNNEGTPSSAELSVFCMQVAMVLESGLALYDGMETLAASSGNGEGSDMYRNAAEKVVETGTLYDALKEDPRWPKYLVEMVGIGESTGHLEEVMRGLSEYYEREDRMSSAVRSALTYPITLGTMLVVIVLVVLWKVLPVFKRVLSGLGIGMTQSSSTLMTIGTSVGWAVMVLVVLAMLAVLTGVVLLKTKYKDKTMRLICKLFPRIGRLNMRLSSSRIASVLSMMLSSGFSTNDALRSVSLVLTDSEACNKVEKMSAQMDEGAPFADTLEDAAIFEPLHTRMVRMGVAAGREDQVMKKIASIYEEDVETEISNLIAIIEPTLVALLAVVIGAVLLSVMLPMAGILTSLM